MDEHWELRGEFEAPLLTRKPSELVREWPIYVSLEEAETVLPQAVDHIGAEHFMYATDIPHWDSEFPHGLDSIWGHPGLSRDAKEKILYHNARAFYGLTSRAPVPA
jgi:predicted TIM-barrel fold metal-dependent hydrolase